MTLDQWTRLVELMRREERPWGPPLPIDPARAAAAAALVREGALDGMVNRTSPLSNSGAPILTTAAALGFLPLVEAILDAGADPNLAVDPDAASSGFVTLLLAPGASSTGTLPLPCAVACGHVDVVKLLLRRGADPNKRESELRGTALHTATSIPIPEMVEALLEAGADPLAPDVVGQSALDIIQQKAKVGDRKAAAVLPMLEAAAVKWRAKREASKVLQTVRSAEPLVPSRDRGIERLLATVAEGHAEWAVLAVRASIDRVGKALATDGARLLRNAATKRIEKPGSFVTLVRLREQPWTLVVYVVGAPVGTWLRRVERDARLLSALSPAVAIVSTAATLWRHGAVVESANASDDDTATDEQMDARLNAFLEKHGVLVPMMSPDTDGVHVLFRIWDVDPKDVMRVDLLVLER